MAKYTTLADFHSAVDLKLAKAGLPKIGAFDKSSEREDRYVSDCWRLGLRVSTAFGDVKRARREEGVR